MRHSLDLTTICANVIAGAEFESFTLSAESQAFVDRVSADLIGLPYGAPTESDIASECLARLRQAAAFTVHMRQALPADVLAAIDAANETDPDPMVCHSHDWCDANMVMLAAAESLGPFDIENPAHLQRWNHAWDIAHAAGFAI
jgi:hypothetical protein